MRAVQHVDPSPVRGWLSSSRQRSEDGLVSQAQLSDSLSPDPAAALISGDQKRIHWDHLSTEGKAYTQEHKQSPAPRPPRGADSRSGNQTKALKCTSDNKCPNRGNNRHSFQVTHVEQEVPRGSLMCSGSPCSRPAVWSRAELITGGVSAQPPTPCTRGDGLQDEEPLATEDMVLLPAPR
ncbi:hypothetical protein EYF80_053898 [Liparis tanakae]|uniref:Uncharacterized protein n=1 Tax=Liparis tanakae TaxID=230148 RepID=A0A4Z2F4W5_9TELE|nr:hypothetical protein EYF80_053898 [Liparis tanakae]